MTCIGEGGLGVVGKGHHVMRFDLTDDTLRIRTILLSSNVYDDHSLNLRK